MCTEKRLCEDTVKRQPSASQEKRPQKEQNLLTSWFWTCSLQNSEEINFCYLSYSICDILLWQPEQTSATSSILFFLVHLFQATYSWAFFFFSILVWPSLPLVIYSVLFICNVIIDMIGFSQLFFYLSHMIFVLLFFLFCLPQRYCFSDQDMTRT